MTVISSITGVFDDIGEWITGFLPKLIPIFYNAESGLTFYGTLAVAGLAFSVFFLLMGLLQRFLHFAG